MLRSSRETLMAVAAAAAVAAGCGNAEVKAPPANPAPATAAEARPAPKLPQAVLPDGDMLRLEVVSTPEEISQGMMYRPSLATDRGMLFLFAEERVPSFWMKNTLIALDIIFLDASGVVVDIAHNAQPCAAEPCPQYVPKKPVKAVLEVAGGVAEQHDLGEGSRLAFERVEGYPAE